VVSLSSSRFLSLSLCSHATAAASHAEPCLPIIPSPKSNRNILPCVYIHFSSRRAGLVISCTELVVNRQPTSEAASCPGSIGTIGMMDWVAMARGWVAGWLACCLYPADSATKNFVPRSTRHRHRRHIDYRENGMVHHAFFRHTIRTFSSHRHPILALYRPTCYDPLPCRTRILSNTAPGVNSQQSDHHWWRRCLHICSLLSTRQSPTE
jgi:hypothetical protein